VTMQMGNCLLERGHDVRIAYRKSGPISMEHALRLARSISYRWRGLKETRWLTQFHGNREPYTDLEQLRFDPNEIVIATSPDTMMDLRRTKEKVQKVWYCHGLLRQQLDGESIATIAVSPRVIAGAQANAKGRIVGIVPNGMSLDEYFPEYLTRDGIGFIFSSHPVKGPEVLVKLAKELARSFPEVPCRSFGGDRRWMGLSGCQYTRYPSVDKAREIYNQSKVWLVTSRDEGFCLPILEAMACGCAVISSDHTNAAELIQDGVNGFIVPYGGVKQYLERIRLLLTDESLREAVTLAGFRTVRQYSWSAAVKEMEKVLAKLDSQGQ
jgi:glycosyltransferase involved in cell wall biosynthesis